MNVAEHTFQSFSHLSPLLQNWIMMLLLIGTLWIGPLGVFLIDPFRVFEKNYRALAVALCGVGLVSMIMLFGLLAYI